MIAKMLVLGKVDNKYCGLWIRKWKAKSDLASFLGLKIVNAPCKANNKNAKQTLT